MSAQLLADLTACFPDRAPLTISRWEALTSGWANTVYAFDLLGADGRSDPLILKQFAAEAAASKEARALQALGDAGYPVPHVWLAQTTQIVMERFAGQPLWSVYEAASASEQAALGAQFVRLLLDLQTLDPHLLAAEPDAETIPQREIERLRADHRPEFRAVIDWLDVNCVACPRAVIAHRDYHPWNVLIDQTGRAVVLDWEWEIADLRYDLAWMLTLMQRSGFADFSAAALAEYQRQTGQPVEQLPYFEVLTTTRWLMNVTRSLQSGANLRTGAADEFRTFLAQPIQRAQTLIAAITGIPKLNLLRTP